MPEQIFRLQNSEFFFLSYGKVYVGILSDVSFNSTIAVYSIVCLYKRMFIPLG